MRFISFSSGSCGNCSLVLGPSSGILIDAGVGIRKVRKEIEAAGLGMDSISAILITHDHGDHIRSLGSWCKRLERPVWTSADVHGALARHPMTKDWIAPCRKVLESGEWTRLTEDFEVYAFEVPHDATQCLGYALRCQGEMFVLMTDLGHMVPEGLRLAREAQTVVIESNYDTDMLHGGLYPEVLKERISQGAGHLSNADCARAICEFWHPGLRNLFLCHLSGNNNTPKQAYDSARQALDKLGVPAGETALRVLYRSKASPLLNL